MPANERLLFTEIATSDKESEVTQTPKTLAQRLEYVGTALYGRHGWTGRLAKGLGIGRTMLWHYRNGERPDRDIDGELLALIEREREATTMRAVELTKLRHRVVGLVGRSPNGGSGDAAA